MFYQAKHEQRCDRLHTSDDATVAKGEHAHFGGVVHEDAELEQNEGQQHQPLIMTREAIVGLRQMRQYTRSSVCDGVSTALVGCSRKRKRNGLNIANPFVRT